MGIRSPGILKIKLEKEKLRIKKKTLQLMIECPWVTPEVRAAINRNKMVYKKWVKRGRDREGKRQVNLI